MKQDIAIIRGTTNTFSISISDASGNPYVLQSGDTIRFGVKSFQNNATYDISKTLTSASRVGDVYQFTISASDTINLACGGYFYDIGLQNSNGYFNIIECSNFTISQNITKEVTL